MMFFGTKTLCSLNASSYQYNLFFVRGSFGTAVITKPKPRVVSVQQAQAYQESLLSPQSHAAPSL